MSQITVCSLCGECNPERRCGNDHLICGACVKAIMITAQKVLGESHVIPPCPHLRCDAYIDDTRKETPQLRQARLVKLDLADPDSVRILAEFSKTIKNANIQGVFRVENPALLAIFEACRARMIKETRIVGGKDVGANERQLFHGTASRAAVGGIVREGFDTHRSGTAHGQAYGPGVYLADKAEISDGYATMDATGVQSMFIVRALLGDPNDRDSKVGFPGSFIVFREQQVLPIFLIMYKK